MTGRLSCESITASSVAGWHGRLPFVRRCNRLLTHSPKLFTEQEAADVSKIADMDQKPVFLDTADLNWLRKQPEVPALCEMENPTLIPLSFDMHNVFPEGGCLFVAAAIINFSVAKAEMLTASDIQRTLALERWAENQKLGNPSQRARTLERELEM